jgi:hypothetical protein
MAREIAEETKFEVEIIRHDENEWMTETFTILVDGNACCYESPKDRAISYLLMWLGLRDEA